MPFVSKRHIEQVDTQTAQKFSTEYLPIGKHPETGDLFLMYGPERFSGTYVCGVQGGGKSGLIENMVVQDAKLGNAVILIDPHGDLVMRCLAVLPSELLAKVIYLNMEDIEYPLGVNLLGAGNHQGDEIAQMQGVDRIMHIFEVVWADVLKQHHLPRYLRAAVITLLANPGTTLVDMQTLLLDDDVRAQMLKHVSDQSVLDFWKNQYDDLPYNDRMKRVQPLLGRLELLFMGRSLVRNIVGQPENSIDFRAAIEQKQLIFITLPTKSLTLDSRLIGNMLVAQFHNAVFSFANLPADKRPGVSLYVDEFQNFVTSDIAELFTEGRKFGVKLTVAHQYRSQLPDYLQAATMTARTKICFQLTPDDGREMSHLFQTGYAELRPEDIDPHPIKHLLTYPIDDYHVKLFVDRFLRPLQSMRSGGRVEVTPKLTTLTAMRGEEMPTYELWDPTLHLDQLLYEVMTTGNPHMRIPFDIVEGFSGCGHSFYYEWRHVLDREWWLGRDITYPAALAIQKPDGTMEWTRRPDDGREELYCFIFVLRQTMRYLAKHPIGDAKRLGTSEVATMLTQLPPRAAFVHSGEDIGVIYSLETGKAVTDDELSMRLQVVQAQTREKYCRPRAEVEASFLKPTEKPDTKTKKDKPLKRWEEL